MRTQACNNLGPTRFIAPSPSGKAPDSDSGIGGSNPSGAAKHERSDLTIGPFLLPDYFCPAQRGWSAHASHPEVEQRSPAGDAPTPPSSGRDAASARRGTTRTTGHSQAAPPPPRAGAATAGTCYEMPIQRLRKPPGPAKENLPRNPAHRRLPIAGAHCADPKTTKARHGRAFEAGTPANRDATNAMDQRLENWVARRALCRPTFLRSTSRASRVMKPALRSSDFRVSSYSTSARAMPRRIAPA